MEQPEKKSIFKNIFKMFQIPQHQKSQNFQQASEQLDKIANSDLLKDRSVLRPTVIIHQNNTQSNEQLQSELDMMKQQLSDLQKEYQKLSIKNFEYAVLTNQVQQLFKNQQELQQQFNQYQSVQINSQIAQTVIQNKAINDSKECQCDDTYNANLQTNINSNKTIECLQQTQLYNEQEKQNNNASDDNQNSEQDNQMLQTVVTNQQNVNTNIQASINYQSQQKNDNEQKQTMQQTNQQPQQLIQVLGTPPQQLTENSISEQKLSLENNVILQDQTHQLPATTQFQFPNNSQVQMQKNQFSGFQFQQNKNQFAFQTEVQPTNQQPAKLQPDTQVTQQQKVQFKPQQFQQINNNQQNQLPKPIGFNFSKDLPKNQLKNQLFNNIQKNFKNEKMMNFDDDKIKIQQKKNK